MNDYLPRACPKPVWAATTLALGVALAGCGGGGGGGGVPFVPVASSPAPAPVKAPAPAPNPLYQPVPGSEPLPSLKTPQPGSTAAIGNDSEGIYAATDAYLVVGPNGSVAGRTEAGSLWGSMTISRSSWTFDPGTEHLDTLIQPVTGSGSLIAKSSLTGRFAKGTAPAQQFGPFEYVLDNALAVSQESVSGKWSSGDKDDGIGVSIQSDARGAFTGTTKGSGIGTCKISGTIAHAEPGTAKNMYRITLTATDAAPNTADACNLQLGLPYEGPSFIALVGAGRYVGNGYFRSIAAVTRTAAGGTLAIFLSKQR